ncbi:DNA glycosylase AlkZ-like family protein [Micromonospora sp. SL4-19]|uniref:DNA glycosylase AlkZ-like family protein n=1 Tax=Micromonospora sp. SL4-19 TaxID=3399129 RepID=UPI003A4D2404
MTPLSRRALNRALLQRQFLLERTDQAPLNVIRRLVALQAQNLIRRYLAAFGPATVADVQAWSGLTRLNQVVANMGIELRHYTGPDGQTLLDLPDAHLPDPRIPAPVRLLPAYDNALLGHADRTRIISDEDRKQVMPGRALVHPTILIDGFVRGTWSFTGDDIRLVPFRPLATVEQQAVNDEANRMLPFLMHRRAS